MGSTYPGPWRIFDVSRELRKKVKGDEPSMVHLLAYLTDFPHCGSPLLFSTCPQPIEIEGLHPSPEGRGQVATGLGVDEPKRDDKN